MTCNSTGTIRATSTATGDVFDFTSRADLEDRGGFDATHVYLCLNGKRNQHAGFTFVRLSNQPIEGVKQ